MVPKSVKLRSPYSPPPLWRPSRASACRTDTGARRARRGQPRPECLLAQILVVVASTPSGEERGPGGRGVTRPPPALCAVEDWSGAGFHIKQSLNVGQPTVSQVVTSPRNQGRHGGVPPAFGPPPSRGTTGARAGLPAVREWQTGKHGQPSAVMGLEQTFLGGDAQRTVDRQQGHRPGGAAHPPGSSRFLLMAGSCGLSIGMTNGGVRPPPSKAARPPRWWSPFCPRLRPP